MELTDPPALNALVQAVSQFSAPHRHLQRDGMLVWLPEAGGPVDLDVPTHRVLMQVLAAQSQREVVRSRHRTVAAMTAQTVEQGRFLGGRPPYGYRLVDAGPHSESGARCVGAALSSVGS